MKTIAFYLPQFHSIPENDLWWGEGFTDWTNVRRAKPQFLGHRHPRIPALGEYDLADSSVYSWQTALARRYGVDAFCIYYYWFDGQRLLERPVEAWRNDPKLLPYCLSWANESWTRRWDGKSRDILVAQSYLPGYAGRLFEDILPHLHAPHYLRHKGRPVLVVHRANVIPDPLAFSGMLRKMAIEAGLSGIYLVAAETIHGLDPRRIGFDAIAEFPPVGANTLRTSALAPIRGVSRHFKGRLMSYDRLATYYARRREPAFVRHRGVVPGWDNTARRQSMATVYTGATPARFEAWVRDVVERERAARAGDGLIFVNAWNEWAEGAYLEPDIEYGYSFLEAIQRSRDTHSTGAADPMPIAWWSIPQLRSIAVALAGSALKGGRRLRAHLPRQPSKSEEKL